mmetsp:Transcript_27734/g.78455  ORF Transcript_27734/g.78455 Transcript_27734/m.78455 type:complete len:231 (-) Transcript_27734:570-1262(-)
MWPHGLRVHLDHQLGNAGTGGLAHGVVVGLGLHDVVGHNLGGEACRPKAALVAHHQRPGLLRVEPYSLRLVVAVQAHGRPEGGELLLLQLRTKGLHEEPRAHRGCVAHLAPVVAKTLDQLLGQLGGHRGQEVRGHGKHQRLDYKVADLTDEPVGVQEAPVDELPQVGSHKQPEVRTDSLHDLLESPVGGLQALPALCHVPHLALARHVHLVDVLHELTHETLGVAAGASV